MKNLKLLIHSLEQVIPSHQTINQALIKTLKLNKDAVSRRLSGKTPFTYSEVCELSRTYGIALAPSQTVYNSNVVFGYTPFKNKHGDTKQFFQNISKLLQQVNQHKHKLLYHVAPEVPVYHYYNYPLLFNFKIFYWGKYLLNEQAYMKSTFEDIEIDSNIVNYTKKAYADYCQIPSVEIWTPQTVQAVLSQLYFCIETGDFTHKKTIESVLNELTNMMAHIRSMAEENNKLFDSDKKQQVSFQFYKIDVNINTTSILAEMDNHKVVYQPFNSINYMNTTQPEFCNENLEWIHNIQAKSSLLSGAGIVERQKYFSFINKQINEFRESLKKFDLE